MSAQKRSARRIPDAAPNDRDRSSPRRHDSQSPGLVKRYAFLDALDGARRRALYAEREIDRRAAGLQVAIAEQAIEAMQEVVS